MLDLERHIYIKVFQKLLLIYCTRVGTLIVATIYLQRSHKGLSPCDFHLIPKMKEPLRGIRFRTVPEILQAVDRSIRTINTTGAAKGILRLPHRWQRVVHNADDYIEGQLNFETCIYFVSVVNKEFPLLKFQPSCYLLSHV